MFIAGIYSFNEGERVLISKYPHLYAEIKKIINKVDAAKCKTKISLEKTMKGKKLYNPIELNKEFKKEFKKEGWLTHKEYCNYPKQYYTKIYTEKYKNINEERFKNAYREMDYIKEKLGIEVQLGKYAFMVYNVCAKMTIFNNLGLIDTGVEIVPIKKLANEMSTGVSYFEQFVWDLEQRGISNIDIPVLIIGIDND
jgi:hypothetical protein